jgi:hypothetical protein
VALSKLQDAFAVIPGPKSIVWITSGVTNWPDYPHGCKDMTITDASGSYVGGKCTANCRRLSKCVDYEPFFQHFSSVLNHTNTVVDAAEDLPQGALPPNNRGTAVDTLQRMADLSGGRLYPGTNIDKAILEAMKNGRGRYQISIAAPAANGKYHKVRLTCARKGVRVEGPKGYFADQSQQILLLPGGGQHKPFAILLVVGVLGVKLSGRLIFLQRAAAVALLLQCVAQAGVHGGIIGIQAQGFTFLRNGPIHIAPG